MISQLEGEYSFINKYTKPKENTFKAIFIPNNDNAELCEIYLSKDSKETVPQILELLNCEELLPTYLSNNDSSLFYYPSLNKKENKEVPTKSLPVNNRACKFKKGKKLLGGNVIFIRRDQKRQELDITVEQFKSIEKYFIPKQIIFDFENNSQGSSTDLVSLILEKSTFNFNTSLSTINVNGKTPNSIINEYRAIMDQISIDTHSFSICDSGPFYSICKINGTIEIYSSIFKKKDESQHNVHLRSLKYLVVLQQKQLGHLNNGGVDEIINNDYTFKIESLKEINEFNQNNNLLSPPTPTKYNVNNNQESILPNEKKRIEIEIMKKLKSMIVDPLDTIKLFGIELNYQHRVIPVNEYVENHLIFEHPTNKQFVKFGDEVQVEFSYYLQNGTCIKEHSNYKVVIGDTENCIQGIHCSLLKMCRGDIVLSIVHSSMAYGNSGIVSGGVPPNSTIGVLLELKDIFQRVKPTNIKLSTMSPADKIEFIKQHNTLGKSNFINGEYCKAMKYYKHSSSVCQIEHIGKMSSDEWDEFEQLATITYTNIAICYDKLGIHSSVIEYCNKSLQFQDTAKAFRLISNAYKSLSEFDKSIENLKIAKEIDSYNTAPFQSQLKYDSELKQLSIQQFQQTKKESEIFQKLFDNDQEEDDELDLNNLKDYFNSNQ